MHDRVLYTYALAKSLHEKGGDILDVFVPFVLKTLELSNSVLGREEIKELLKEEFSLDIPNYSISSIITRAKRRGYVKQKRKTLYLTNEAMEFLSNVNDSETKRDENKFINSLQKYLEEKDIKLSNQEVAKKLRAVINSNLCSLVTYLGEKPKLSHCEQLDRKESREIINFFKDIESSDNELFKILKSIIMGSIICAMVKKDEGTLKTKLKPAKVFLDTNVIFSLLDYHHPDISLPVKELFNLLKENGYKFYVFPFTVQEIIRVLNNYKNHYKDYNTAVKVNSIYNRLKYLRLTPSDMTEIIVNIENKLTEKDINIYPLTNEDLKINDEEYNKLSEYKYESNHSSLEHDLYAIEGIKKIRGKRIRKLERAGAIFLTSDQKLTQYNFKEDGHKINASINEVILDQLMTNVLWFKKPNINSNLPLHAVMSLHAAKLFVDNDIWKRFHCVVKEMEQNNKISEEDLSIMLYNDKIEEVLLDYEGEVNEIDELFVEGLIEKSRINYQEREDVFKLQQKENERLNKEKKKVNEEKEEILDSFSNLAKNMLMNASKKANKWTNIIIYVVIPITLFLISLIARELFPYGSNIIKNFIPIISLAVGMGIIPRIPLKDVINININKYFTKKIKSEYFDDGIFEKVNSELITEFAPGKED